MAWGKDNLAIENVRLEAKVEAHEQRIADLTERIAELKEMLKHAQEALVAKEAPEAYRDRRYAEYEANRPDLTDEEREELMARRRRAETNSRYLDEIEMPLFKDAEDMIQMLSRPEGVPESPSIHGNSES